VFTSLETAQRLTERPGLVNDVVLTIGEDADRDTIAAALEDRLDEAGIGATVTTRDESTAYRLLTRDADNDQQFFDIFAFLILGGAAAAAFNLITRMVEQQRREIGIGMSLGVPGARLALRPLLVAAQIALLGVVFGIGIGWLIGAAMRTVLVDFLPLPEWVTTFQFGVFARAAAVGFVLPFLAAAIPVWRATRVTPVEALRPAHLNARGGWLSRITRGLRLPGDTFTQIPFRNLTRFPRRTLLTVLGISAAIMLLVTLLAVVDSFLETVERAETESLGGTPERVVVDLDAPAPINGDTVTAVRVAGTVHEAEGVLHLVGRVYAGGEELDIALDLIDLDGGMWAPTISAGAVGDAPGLVLTEAAAADLDVSVGDEVVLRHPVATGDTAFGFADTRLPVAATHPYPLRPVTYMDIDHAGLMGFDGMVNGLSILPADGAGDDDIRKELFSIDGVAAVRPVTEATEQVRASLDQVLGILQVISALMLLLALLIALNSASVALEARRREHATFFAYGVPVRRAMRMAITESFIIGVIATVIGLVGGIGLSWWMLTSSLKDTMPDFAAVLSVQPGTVAIAAVLGVLVVALAPVLTVRRMRSMDLPGTLRLVE
jgi:putative ABC transport system permease protein